VNGKKVLVDEHGRTLYAYSHDKTGESKCDGDCANTWPPLVGPATAGSGVDAGQLKTAAREDGTMQVTYFGDPLYYFNGDDQPGDVKGAGVGGTWYLVTADGKWTK